MELTIGVPTFNGERHLREALRSAVATGSAVLVSDDASGDRTLDVVGEFPSVSLARQKHRRGIGDNFQWLLDNCETSHLLILNQDDVLLPGALEDITMAPARVTVMNGWVVDQDGAPRRLIHRRPPAHGVLEGAYAGMRKACFVHSTSQVVIPVSETRRVGGFVMPSDAPGQGAEDWLCWARLAAARVPFQILMRPRVRYRMHAESFTQDEHSRAAFLASCAYVREHFPDPPRRDRRVSVRW